LPPEGPGLDLVALDRQAVDRSYDFQAGRVYNLESSGFICNGGEGVRGAQRHRPRGSRTCYPGRGPGSKRAGEPNGVVQEQALSWIGRNDTQQHLVPDGPAICQCVDDLM
jgi:hypothetical protein